MAPTALLLGCSVRVIGLDVGPGQNSTAVCQNETAAAAEFSCVVDRSITKKKQKETNNKKMGQYYVKDPIVFRRRRLLHTKDERERERDENVIPERRRLSLMGCQRGCCSCYRGLSLSLRPEKKG